MTFSTKILTGLAAGVATGLFLGETAGALKIVADGFVKLLQMTVLPYVTISIVLSLGSLSYEQARLLGIRAGAVLLVLWALALAFAFVIPFAFPATETASFFSTTLIEKRPAFNFVDLFIPSNPFNSLANNIVPAVVLFSAILGIALIGLERKAVLLDVLSVANQAVARATRFVLQLTPYGIFAIAATAAGTLNIDQVARIQVYLITYVAVALLVALWVLPGLVAAVTPFRYREVLGPTRNALITAFIAGDLFIVLPALIDQCKILLDRHHLADGPGAALPDVIVPASFNFPHTGKLLSISFILFAGWFADSAVSVSQYPVLALSGLLTFFGSLNAAVPFLLDLFRIPADTFQLFLATGVVNSRVGSLVAAVHTVAVTLLGSAAILGAVRIERRRVLRFVVITVLLTGATIGGLRVAFSSVLAHPFSGADIMFGMQPLYPHATPTLIRDEAQPVETSEGRSVLDGIRARHALRVGVVPDRLPYTFLDRRGVLTGFDVEMAYRLAGDIDVSPVFVAFDSIDGMADALDRNQVDIVMMGAPVTPQRAIDMLFSDPYLDETLAFIVRDHLREEFSTWESIGDLSMTVIAPDLPYYVNEVRRRAPSLKLQVESDPRAIDAALARGTADAVVLPAERGSAITLLYPQYSVVVPEPGIVKVPLAYPLARRDQDWAHFVNTWIALKRRDGTIDALYRHWILGQDAVPHQPRWSVIRNVLHWVE